MSHMDYGPYSTREMHKQVRYGINKKDQARVVEKTSFVSIGESKEKPEPYKGGKVKMYSGCTNVWISYVHNFYFASW